MVRPLETLDPDTTIAKIVFVLAQLVYAIVSIVFKANISSTCNYYIKMIVFLLKFTIFHTAYLYTTFQGSCLYLVFVFLHGVWNGGLSGNGFTSIRFWHRWLIYIEMFQEYRFIYWYRYSFKLDVDVNDARVIHDDDDDDEIEVIRILMWNGSEWFIKRHFF